MWKRTVEGQKEYNRKRRERYKNDLEYRAKVKKPRSREEKDRQNRTRNVQYMNDSEYRNKKIAYERAKTVEQIAWMGMKQRVLNKNRPDYPFYKDRHIDPRWMVFDNFYADMGPCPNGMTLERIDNSKGYCPSNCQWDTRSKQARNRVPGDCHKKLNAFVVKEIRSTFSGGALIKEVAKQFNISTTHAVNIKNGRRWANV